MRRLRRGRSDNERDFTEAEARRDANPELSEEAALAQAEADLEAAELAETATAERRQQEAASAAATAAAAAIARRKADIAARAAVAKSFAAGARTGCCDERA